MKQHARLAVLAAMLAGCTLLVGTETRIVGDAGLDDAMNEAAPPDANAEGSTDAAADAPLDVNVEACATITPCLVEAGTCGAGCVQADTTCRAGCSGSPCKKACDQTETTCLNDCVVACTVCTTVAGCASQAACADAAATD